jgi:hypothetical protein
MSDELKRKILEKYLEHSEQSQDFGTWHHKIADELTDNKDEKSLIIAECGFLQDDGCLEDIMREAFGKNSSIGVRITSKGKRALSTTLDPKWVKQNEKEKQEEKDLKKREIKNVETSLKWTKVGVIGAIVIGIISLIYTALKP